MGDRVLAYLGTGVPTKRIDLARVYTEIWKDAAPAHLVDIAVFCDSDETHTASISYFAYVRLERVMLRQVCCS